MLAQALLQVSQRGPMTRHRQEYPGALRGNAGQLPVPQTLGRELPAFVWCKVNQSTTLQHLAEPIARKGLLASPGFAFLHHRKSDWDTSKPALASAGCLV